jgi:hypothetical protein
VAARTPLAAALDQPGGGRRNFVLMELGQPLHAYDLVQLRTALQVRRASERALTLSMGAK